MQPIATDLYQFSTYVKAINLTFHQYLLFRREPVLFHTGNIQQSATLVPELKSVLGGIPLKYIFISHFEADECGGLSYILLHFPEAKPICSEVTARQLAGFGIADEMVTKKPGERLIAEDFELEFMGYPSEMHLWQGLLALERKRGIFFSSDLMLEFGESKGLVVESNWQNEINNIKPEQIPDTLLRRQLQENLLCLSPQFIATGHGPCIKIK
jgi:flavorubredoxin